MELWTEIRRRVLTREISKRQACREYEIHWDTLRKILTHEEPPGFQLNAPRKRPVIGPFLSIIREILEADKKVHPKQRHTAKRIFDRLKKEHGYPGGETAVKDAVREYKRKKSEVFMPLSKRAGTAQVDYGEARIFLNGEETKVALFVMTLPYSGAIFIQVFPRECTETFQEGHRRAFEFLSGVPTRISYDNSRIAVKKVIHRRGREFTREFLRLESHYLFEHHFCLVRRANEKGHVENLLGFARRNFLVPLPRVESLETLNESLLEACLEDMNRRERGKASTKAELLLEDQQAFLPLPKQAFEARRVATCKASSESLCRFDTNDYSIPTEFAHHDVTAIGSIEEVRFVVNGCVVARHKRSWRREQTFFDPGHYLALLEKKPGALDFAKPLEDWDLPGCFHVLRRRLETDLGRKGVRQFIQVLRLLEHAEIGDLAGAVRQALDVGATSACAIRLILEHRLEQPTHWFRLDDHPHLSHVHVPTPNLSEYATLTRGECA